jgi:hypothetical protein
VKVWPELQPAEGLTETESSSHAWLSEGASVPLQVGIHTAVKSPRDVAGASPGEGNLRNKSKEEVLMCLIP